MKLHEIASGFQGLRRTAECCGLNPKSGVQHIRRIGVVFQLSSGQRCEAAAHPDLDTT